MNGTQKSIFLVMLFLFFTYGCSGSVRPQPAEPQKIQEEFEIGITTKEDVISRWGNPSGISINEKGEEILTYNKSHMTGKSFIPFYFGRDHYRMKFYNFTFNKEGILIGMSSNEQHY